MRTWGHLVSTAIEEGWTDEDDEQEEDEEVCEEFSFLGTPVSIMAANSLGSSWVVRQCRTGFRVWAAGPSKVGTMCRSCPSPRVLKEFGKIGRASCRERV